MKYQKEQSSESEQVDAVFPDRAFSRQPKN